MYKKTSIFIVVILISILILLSILVPSWRAEKVARIVFAVEIQPRDDVNRGEMISSLKNIFQSYGGHVDDKSDIYRNLGRQSSIRSDDVSLFLIGWGGEGDKKLIMTANDMGHIGKVWIILYGSKNPRHIAIGNGVISYVHKKWPDYISIPIINGSSVPLDVAANRQDKSRVS